MLNAELSKILFCKIYSATQKLRVYAISNFINFILIYVSFKYCTTTIRYPSTF